MKRKMLKIITLESEIVSITELKQLVPDYELMLYNVLVAIIERYEHAPEYHFIDTKLNTITGQDFCPAAEGEEFKSKEVIYSWIQGRGIEALTGHAQWLPVCTIVDESEKSQLLERIQKLLHEVMATMELCRAANNGHLFFWMRPDGQNLAMDSSNQLIEVETIPFQSNYSDLFYAKGLFVTANYLNITRKATEAELYLKKVIEDIQNNNFLSDQQTFDIKNQVAPLVGKNIQGPWMIALGGIASGIQYGEQAYWMEKAQQFISHIIDVHINTGDNDYCQRYDFWEAVDNVGRPWEEANGAIICDPGHALEFIGLASKCLLLMRGHNKYKSLIERCKQLFPKVLTHAFELGFNEKSGGICKAYDLKKRTVLNGDMPWWSLPETMRAAIELLELNPETSFKQEIITIISKCSNAFVANYINYDLHMMAYQTRNASGKVIEVIPATPDADPGYHTGLSIIDFIKISKCL
jgi:hypothetical protein